MAASHSAFRPIERMPPLMVAERGNLRCVAIRLSTGGLCLFSPLRGLGDEAMASLSRLGDVEFLLAPNHYHNAGLTQHRRAFPSARLCASEAARPRLERVTGLQFETLDDVRTALPDNIVCLEPKGLKTGEVWLRAVAGDDTAWVVVDAFCGPAADAGRSASDPAMLRTFPGFGIGNRSIYLEWLEAQLAADSPNILVPCHGAIVVNSRLTARLRALVAE